MIESTPSRPNRLWARAAAVVLFVFGFLPVVNWVRGGREWPRYGSDLEGWLAGSAISLGLGIIFVIVARRVPRLWRSDAVAPLIRVWVRRPRATTAALTLASLGLYALSARRIFSGRPLLVDEVIQLYQARLFASGRIAGAVDAMPELFSALFLLERDGKIFSQFPPGGPAVLAVGVAIGAVWLIVPLCGALAVACFATLCRRIEPDRPGVSLLASLVFACAPFMVFMSGSQMNHVPTLLGVVLALLALERATSIDEAHRLVWGFVCGLALGFAATIRPPDAIAFAMPAAVALLFGAARDRRRVGALLASGVGIAIPIGAMLWFNQRTTGAPLLFGYEAMWGKSHGIGFHAAPWGAAHTPARGLELLSLYFLRLQTYLFETPVPSLAASLGALLLATRLRRLDGVLLAGSAALIVLYFAYWHDGFYLGPRFFVCLLPALALWSARLFAEWRARWGRGESYRVLVASSVVCVVIALGVSVPLRAQQYRSGLKTMRWDLEGSARAAGVHDALVFVRESWGAQLMVRLWAIGVSHSEAQALYRWVDACALERGLDSLERTGAHGAAARALLLPLLADSSRVVQTPFSADSSERVLPGAYYGPRCVRRVQEDRAGFTVYLPFIVAESDNVVYARDLHARDSALLARYPTRPVYLVRPPTAADGVAPQFWPISRDSLRADWAKHDSP